MIETLIIIALVILFVIMIAMGITIRILTIRIDDLNELDKIRHKDHSYWINDVRMNRTNILDNSREINKLQLKINTLESFTESLNHIKTIDQRLDDRRSDVINLHKMYNLLRTTVTDMQDEIILLEDVNEDMNHKLKKLKKKC